MNYKGQTVNERLGASGNFKRFDRAVKNNDKATLKDIFAEIELPDYDLNVFLKYKRKTIFQRIKNLFK